MTRGWWVTAFAALIGVVWHAFGVGPFLLQYPMVGASPDAFGTLWMYDWVRESVLAGQFPVSTDRMYYPEGVQFLVRNGANVLDALISVPLQVFLGPGKGELWTCVIIVVGNVVSFFPLARRLAPGHPAAAIVATAWWGANPFVLSELGGGRPTQAMLWFVPPAVAALLRLNGWGDAVRLGIFVGLQGLTYWYLPIFFALVLFPVGVAHVLRDWRAALRLGVAVLVAVACVVPLALPILRASQAGEIPGLGLNIDETGMWMESMQRSARLGAQLALISTCVGILAIFARVRAAPALALGAFLGLGFALGGRFAFFGLAAENPIYVWLFENSGFIARLNFPARVLAVVYCVAAVSLVPILAAGRIRFLPFLLLVLLVLEGRANHLGPGRVISMPPLPASVIIAANPGSLLSTPMGASDVAMAQQLFHRQPMVSGMADHVLTVRASSYDVWLKNPYFAELVQADDLMRPWTREEQAAVRSKVRWVWFDRALLARGTESSLTETIESRLEVALGEPYYRDPYTAIWDLTRPDTSATEAEIALAAAAEAVLDSEGEVCKMGESNGVLWSWGDGRFSMVAGATPPKAP